MSTPLSELRESIAQVETKLKQAKAEIKEEDQYYALFDYFYEMNRRTREYLYELENALAQHANPANGHLPKIKGAGKMANVLSKLGMDDDYNVEKPVIHTRASRSGRQIFDVELRTKKD
jgi:hypothetical protein